MTKISRSAVSITLAIALAAVGGLSLGYIASGHKDTTSLIPVVLKSTQPQGPYMPKSEAGAYLIAQRAEAGSDWPGTHRALKNLSEMTTLPAEQTARFFLSAIASGDWETARAIVKKQPQDITESAPMVRMLYAIMMWSDKNDAEAAKAIGEVQYNPLSQLILPFAKAYMTKETPVLNIMQAAQDIGYYTVNMVRYFESTGQYDKSDPLMVKFQQADLNMRLRAWSVAYFKRRGMTAEAAKAQALLDISTSRLPKDVWEKELHGVLAEADGHLKSPQRALSLAMIDATEFLEANNASAIALLFTQSALKLTPDLYGGNMLLGSLYESQENWEEARQAFATIPQNDPSYMSAQLRIATDYAEDGQSDKAEALYTKLLSLYPNTPEVQFQYGEFQRIDRKDYKRAIASYDKVEKILGKNIPDVYWTLYLARGLCYELLGQPKKAEQNYQVAYDLQPQNSEALNTLAYSWTEQGIHLDKARDMLQRALLANPTAPHIMDSYGWVLFKQGEFADAMPYLERAASMMPYDPTINEHLGDVYEANGRKREAQFMWQRAFDNADDEKQKTRLRTKLNDAL